VPKKKAGKEVRLDSSDTSREDKDTDCLGVSKTFGKFLSSEIDKHEVNKEYLCDKIMAPYELGKILNDTALPDANIATQLAVQLYGLTSDHKKDREDYWDYYCLASGILPDDIAAYVKEKNLIYLFEFIRELGIKRNWYNSTWISLIEDFNAIDDKILEDYIRETKGNKTRVKRIKWQATTSKH
jgi:hypothetical protein